MDVAKVLRELYTEKKRLDTAIARLESRVRAGQPGAATKAGARRRGRKSMSAAERQEVSKRMTLYWEARRAQLSSATALVPAEEHQARSTAVT
jgi:hypothetical protein